MLNQFGKGLIMDSVLYHKLKNAHLVIHYYQSKANGDVKKESEWIRDWHYRDLDDNRDFEQFWDDQDLIEVEKYDTTTKRGKIVQKWRIKE
jgi:hypothetical protein